MQLFDIVSFSLGKVFGPGESWGLAHVDEARNLSLSHVQVHRQRVACA